MRAFGCSVAPVAIRSIPRIFPILYFPLPTLHVPTTFLTEQAYGHFPQYLHNESLFPVENGLRDPRFVPPAPPLCTKRLGKQLRLSPPVLNPSTSQILPSGSQGSKKSRISSAEKKNSFPFLNVEVFFFFLLSLMKSKTLMCPIAPLLQICSDLAHRVLSPRLRWTQLRVVGMWARKRVDSIWDKITAIYAASIEAKSSQFT